MNRKEMELIRVPKAVTLVFAILSIALNFSICSVIRKLASMIYVDGSR